MHQYKRIQEARIRREETDDPRAKVSPEEAAEKLARRAKKTAQAEAVRKKHEAATLARRQAVVAMARVNHDFSPEVSLHLRAPSSLRHLSHLLLGGPRWYVCVRLATAHLVGCRRCHRRTT